MSMLALLCTASMRLSSPGAGQAGHLWSSNFVCLLGCCEGDPRARHAALVDFCLLPILSSSHLRAVKTYAPVFRKLYRCRRYSNARAPALRFESSEG